MADPAREPSVELPLHLVAGGGTPFVLKSAFRPMGDQPQAIDELCEGLGAGRRHQVLLGATGTGKTFTMANVIAR